ncbi:MAG: 50S ribosomal protein L11 methyltransferase [Gammaproteobacteria bacterium]|nr:50S ribosomal protein L11 methyltransferase [Gammaproteobacteria bacterium]
MTAQWIQLVIPDLGEQAAERWTGRLEAAGAMAVTLLPRDARFDEPGVMPAQGGTSDLCALFDAEPRQLITRLRTAYPDLPPHRCSCLADRDWTEVWREHFVPRCFADRLWVCPIDTPLDPGGLPVVRLDPGAAFGTGRHETTALCLTELCRTIKPATRILIDYGCGSGILAIAAAKLGVPTIRAVDIDATALEVARDNIERNEVAAGIEVSTPDELRDGSADLLVGNILLQPLLELAPRFAMLLRPGGTIILSGLLQDQTEECLTAYRSMFAMLPPRIDGDWALLIGTRREGDAA